MNAEGVGGLTCGIGADDEELHCWGAALMSVNWFGDPVAPAIYTFGPGLPYGGRRHERGAHAGAVELAAAASSHQCARYGDDRVRCWSEGVTDGEGKPFASLEAPKQPVSWMSGSFFQMCFVLRGGAVECHSTDGILRLPSGPPARTVASAGHTVCITTFDGALKCQRHIWDDDRTVDLSQTRGPDGSRSASPDGRSSSPACPSPTPRRPTVGPASLT